MNIQLSNEESWAVIEAGMRAIYGDEYNTRQVTLECGCSFFLRINPVESAKSTVHKLVLEPTPSIAAPADPRRRIQELAKEIEAQSEEI